jgi:hypothetical protein
MATAPLRDSRGEMPAPARNERKRANRSVNARSRAEFAALIKAAWQEQVESIFEVGNYLESAKLEIPHGEYIAMIKNDLPFGRYTAAILKKIALDDKLRNVDYNQHLPASWQTLYELTKLSSEQFAAGIETGAINPAMKQKDAKALRAPSAGSRSTPPRAFDDRVGVWLLKLRTRIENKMQALDESQRAELVAGLRDLVRQIGEE